MAIEFNSAALQLFRTAQFDDANAIARLGDGKIGSGGTWSRSIKILGRTDSEKTANNRVREELLRCLGNAFHLGGFKENADGSVEFSREFMDRLSDLLGRDLKAGDFGISGNGGKVSSGKPLTQRRITAILKRAEQVGLGAPESGGRTGGKAGAVNPFDEPLPGYMDNAEKNPFYRDYASKLQIMKEELGVANLSDRELTQKGKENKAFSFIAKANAGLKFLMNELDVSKKRANRPDSSCLRDNPAWQFHQEIAEEGEEFQGSKFEYRDPATHEFVPLKGTAGYSTFLSTQIAGGLIHLDRAPFREEESNSVESLRKYIVDTLKLFVMKTIDLYFESKAMGKEEEYLRFLSVDPGACMEDKGLKLVEFESNVLYSADSMSAEEKRKAEELERIADLAPGKSEPPKSAEKMIYAEIDRLNRQDAKYGNSENWADFADEIKKVLVGTSATIVVPVGKGPGLREFTPLQEDGKDVVRPLTEADIDRLGPVCLANLSEV